MDLDLNCCEEAILQLCQSYHQSKPTVHDVMKDAQKLENLISSFSSIPVNVECKWVTAVANHPCFVPENSLNAEVQVNSLLPYLSSTCCWVRSLACSFLRVFTARLDHKGQHIATQVPIICKNLQTTLEESLRLKDSRFQLCQVIACSSLCSIAVSWAAHLPLHSIKFVLLTLRTMMNILSKPDECPSVFLFQVTLDGLGRILKSPATWNVLSAEERRAAVTEYLTIINQTTSSSKIADDLTAASMLEVIDSSEVLQTVLNIPERRLAGKLMEHLMDCLPTHTSSTESPILAVRWKSLRLIYKLFELVKYQDTLTHLAPLLERACCDSEQVRSLCNLLRKTFVEYLRDSSD